MSSTTKQAIIFKNEWLDPETWEKLLPALAAMAAGLAKLKQKLPKRGGSKRDLKKLSDDLDDLQKVVELILGTLQKHSSVLEKFTEKHIEFLESVRGLLKTLNKPGWLQQTVGNMPKVTKIVLFHEQRLAALEKARTRPEA